MYQNISKEDRQAQYEILLNRAHAKAIAIQFPSKDLNDFRRDFADPSVAARFLSQEDFETYEACREAKCR